MTSATPAISPADWGVFGLLVFFVLSLGVALYRGWLVPRTTVDKIVAVKDEQISTLVAGYEARIAALTVEVTEWRGAWRDDHDLVVTMSGQVGQLVTAAEGSAQALQSLTYEAARNRR